MGASESRLGPSRVPAQPTLYQQQALLTAFPGLVLDQLVSHLSLQEKLLLARLVLGSRSSHNRTQHAAAGRLLRLLPQQWQDACGAGASPTCGDASQARAAVAAAILHSVHSLTCILPERGSLRLLADVPELQQLTILFPDLSKQRRRHFDVTQLKSLTRLQQLSITADYSFFHCGPVTKPAMHKQLAATLPQLTTLRQLRLTYVFLPSDSRHGLAGLTRLSQLELLSLDHVLPYITPEAAAGLARGLTALSSLSINQCFFSGDTHRIMEALQPLLPRLQSLGLPRLQSLGHVQDCVQLLRLGLQPSSLRSLNLSRARVFPAITPALAQLTGLQELALSQADLAPHDVAVMAAALTQLTRLEAPDNQQLSELSLLCLGRLTKLRHVNISWRGALGGEAMSALRSLPHLVTLIAHSKAFDAAALEALGQMSRLQHLDVSSGNLPLLGDASLRSLERLTQLTALQMAAAKDPSIAQAGEGAARFSAGLSRLAALRQLLLLDLRRVEGVQPDVALFVTQLRGLTWLRMDGWCDCSCGGRESGAAGGHGSCIVVSKGRSGCSGAAFQQQVQAALPQLSHFVLRGGCKRSGC